MFRGLVVWFDADPIGVAAQGQVQACVNDNAGGSRDLDRAELDRHIPCSCLTATRAAGHFCSSLGQSHDHRGTAGTGMAMRQALTRDLFAYWDALRGSRKAPDRSEIDPGAIRSSLPDVFLLGLDAQRRYPFRLAGTSVCALFGSELRETAFSALWSPTGGIAMAMLVQGVIDEKAGAVTGVCGRNDDGDTVDLEMILLPLTCRDGERARLIGAVSALHPPYWLGIRPVLTLHSGDVRFVGPAVQTGSAGRLIAGRDNPLAGPGFVVYAAGTRNANSTKSSGLTGR